MNKFLIWSEITYFIQLLLDKIFHSLDIVVGDLLNILYPLGIFERKIPIYIPQFLEQALVKVFELRQWQLA